MSRVDALHALATAIVAECAAEKINSENEAAFSAWISRAEARLEKGEAGLPDADPDASGRYRHSSARYELAKQVTAALILIADFQPSSPRPALARKPARK